MAFLENRVYTPGFPITVKMFDDISFLAHWHSEVELVLVREGSLGMGINSDFKVLEKGDIAIISGGDIHYYDSKDRHSSVLILVFRPELIGSIVDLSTRIKPAVSFLDSSCASEFGISEEILATMWTCFHTIYREMISEKPSYQLLIKAHLIELFGLLTRYLPKVSANPGTVSAGSGSIKLVQQAIRYIETNYSREISLEGISDHLRINPFYFSRVFSKITGMTYKSYLNSVRVEKADALIRTTNKPVIDIAYECGFSSVRTFNRVFRQVRGGTPTNMRQP